MKKLAFLIFPILALLGGVFCGNALRVPPSSLATEASTSDHGTDPMDGQSAVDDIALNDGHSSEDVAWFPFPHQFFIPLMKRGQVSGTMILSVILETPADSLDDVHKQEHRLRDAILRALMVHANTGGFDGNFTTEFRMDRLRKTLLDTARDIAPDKIRDVLIQDLVRQ